MKNAKYFLLSLILLTSNFMLSMETNIININLSKIIKNKKKLNNNFIAAAQKGDLKRIKELLLLGADIDAPESEIIRDTALTWAIYKNHFEISKFLIENQANLNLLDRFRYTPIILAMNSMMSEENRKKLITLLINAGADIYIKYNNQTPLVMADRFKNKELYNIIKISHDKNELLIKELTSDILNKDKIILANFIIKNPTLKDSEGNNALHIAAKNFKPLAFNIIWKIQPNLFNKLNHNKKSPVDAYPEMICQLITAKKLALKNKIEDKNINGKHEEK